MSGEWFDKNGWALQAIPPECVEECAASGDVGEAVGYWRTRLGFSCDATLARKYLLPYGAWSEEELKSMTASRLSEIVLWIACNDIRDGQDWLGMVH